MNRGWRDGSVVKSTDYSSSSEFKSQQPHDGSQPSRNLKALGGRKLTPREHCEGVAKGPRLKEIPLNCLYEKGNEICVTGKKSSAPAGNTHPFKKASVCRKHTGVIQGPQF